jgi:hypothetical protein
MDVPMLLVKVTRTREVAATAEAACVAECLLQRLLPEKLLRRGTAPPSVLRMQRTGPS